MTPAPDPNATDPNATEEFGPYLVHDRLGIGGMATVYRAKKRGIDGYERAVALKRMLSHLTEDRGFVDSFIREAKVASLLVHPNVAQVYDFGRINGIYYIAMELVAGFDMRKLLRHANRTGEPIPLPVVLSILIELCEALEYAHTFVDEQGAALGIVHRDISPSNLILTHSGHLKVIDFGIAKASSRALHTESGQVKGKLGYMSPEAALGMQIGPASDVFSAGVVAWELITASPLFSSKTDFETMRKIREAEIIAPSQYNPSCPPALDAIVLAALERTVERRMPSAAAFRQRLEEIAARAQIQVSARTVAEWMLQVPDADGRARRPSAWSQPGMQPPHAGHPSAPRMPLQPPPETTQLTQNLRMTPRPALQRSTEEAALATEIWGDDIRTSSNSPGPDFSAMAPPPAQAWQPPPYPSAPMPMPMLAPAQAWQPPPEPRPLPPTTQMRAQLPPAEPAPRRRPLVIVLAVAIVATVGAMIGVVWPRGDGKDKAPIAAGGSGDFGSGTGSGSAGVAMTAPTPTPPTPGSAAAAIPTPIPTPTPVTIDHHVPTPTPTHRDHHVETHAHVDPVPEPTPTPLPVTPLPTPTPVPTPTPTPIPVTPTPVLPTPKVPGRTPVVAQSAVTKIAGELPSLQVHGDDTNGDVLAKMCLDESGHISSVKILKSPAEIAGALQQALQAWRYQPYLKDGVASPVCFALSLHVVVRHAD